MHVVLHDWPDGAALRILRNLTPAMSKHSKLLIFEAVIPPTGASSYKTGADLTMMAQFGGSERTESMCKELLEKAGLRMVKIWGPKEAVERIIEARLA